MTPARQRELRSLQIEYAIDIRKWLAECLARVKRYVKPDAWARMAYYEERKVYRC